MLVLTETILRIREACPLFNRRVGGTAKFSIATDMDSEDTLELPCAFVVPMGDVAETRANENATSTWVTERVAVIVCVTNRVDRSRGEGVSASDNLRTAKQQLYDALVAWRPTLLSKPALKLSSGISEAEAALYADLLPTSNLGTYSYMESAHLGMTTAKLWHQFEFEIKYLMDKDTGRDAEGLPHGIHNIFEMYGGWAPEIGYAHIDDYDLLVSTVAEAVT